MTLTPSKNYRHTPTGPAYHTCSPINQPIHTLTLCLPISSLSWFSLFFSQTDNQYPYNFDDLREGDRVGLICDDNSRLHIVVNDIDQGLVDHEMSNMRYAMLDLYGRCEQVSIVPCNKIPELKTADNQEEVVNDIEEEKVSTDEIKGSISSFSLKSCVSV